ncbi:MAG TPA: pilus assembly protein PilM [Symbiobacteriaceae bacterium]|nr:pilus assembly protein PilM [Symbiobacteriaceae bacterium]
MFDRWLKRRPPLIGIDIGTRTVTVVQSAPSPRGLGVKVVGAAEVPTPRGSFHEGQVLDAALLGAAIREAVKAAKLTARTAALAVPAQYGFLRRVNFPVMPVKELRATIDLQPERYIPLARDGSVYDVNLVPGGAPDGQMTAVVAAAPRQNVADLMAACRSAGLKPLRVDLEPLALHRALVASGLADRAASIAMVDLGASAAKISLFEGEVPLITRVVDMPHSQVEGDFFAGTGTEDLFLDIRRSLEFALNQSGARPSRVFIAGGAGNDEFLLISLTGYLRSFLANRLSSDFQVEPLRAPDLGISQSQMLAFGLSLAPELFA